MSRHADAHLKKRNCEKGLQRIIDDQLGSGCVRGPKTFSYCKQADRNVRWPRATSCRFQAVEWRPYVHF